MHAYEIYYSEIINNSQFANSQSPKKKNIQNLSINFKKMEGNESQIKNRIFSLQPTPRKINTTKNGKKIAPKISIFSK